MFSLLPISLSVSASCIPSRETRYDQVSPRAEVRLRSTAVIQRENIRRKCLHPKGFFFFHFKICIPELSGGETCQRVWNICSDIGITEVTWELPRVGVMGARWCSWGDLLVKKWHLWKPGKNIMKVLEQLVCEEYWNRTILWKSLRINKCGKRKGLWVIYDYIILYYSNCLCSFTPKTVFFGIGQ